MTVIKVTCPYCGEQELAETGVLLTTSNCGWARYAFMCPECKNEIIKEANDTVVGLLRNHTKVRQTHVQAPAEWVEDDHTGPALTYDDLLDFVLSLGEDWLPPTFPEKEAQSWPGPS